MSDVEGGIFNANGLNIPELMAAYKTTKSLAKTGMGEVISNEAILTLDVDVLIPAALEGVINEKNAKDVKAKYILEGANGR